MEIKAIVAIAPDISIRLTHAEANKLQSFIYEARCYANDNNENTTSHNIFILALEDAMGT